MKADDFFDQELRRWRAVQAGLPPLSESLQSWHTAIGELIHRMGQIEGETHYFLREMLSPDEYEDQRKAKLWTRLDKMKSIAESHPELAERKQHLLKLVEEVRKLAQTRNIVAHNPLQMTVYDEAEDELRGTGDYRFLRVREGSEVPDLSLEALQEKANQALVIAHMLFQANMKIAADRDCASSSEGES